MEELKQFWLKTKDKLFSYLLILLGLTLTIKAFSVNPSTGLSQTMGFKIAALVLILLGALSLYFVMNKKNNKTIGLITNIVLAFGIVCFTILNVKSIKDTIKRQNAIKTSIALAKQGLNDIQKIAKAYDAEYKNNAPSFEELIRFAKFDSITKLTKAKDDIPPRKMSPEEAKILGYKYGTAVISEEDAVKLGLIVREYTKIPVYSYLFSPEKLKKTKREYDFDIEKLTSYRSLNLETNEIIENEKTFLLETEMAADSVIYLQISALPPYGPQTKSEIKEVYHIGSTSEKSIKPSW